MASFYATGKLPECKLHTAHWDGRVPAGRYPAILRSEVALADTCSLQKQFACKLEGAMGGFGPVESGSGVTAGPWTGWSFAGRSRELSNILGYKLLGSLKLQYLGFGTTANTPEISAVLGGGPLTGGDGYIIRVRVKGVYRREMENKPITSHAISRCQLPTRYHFPKMSISPPPCSRCCVQGHLV